MARRFRSAKSKAIKAPSRSRRSASSRTPRAHGAATPDEPAWHGSGAPETQEAGGALVHLTAREREVLGLICEGLSNKLIGRHLRIAPSTVKVHVSRILRALNVSTRLQAILVTQCWNLLEERLNHHERRRDN